jgi:hypothetical protein
MLDAAAVERALVQIRSNRDRIPAAMSPATNPVIPPPGPVYLPTSATLRAVPSGDRIVVAEVAKPSCDSEEMSEDQLDAAFLATLPNTPISNNKLRIELGWDEAQYRPVKERLVEIGAIFTLPGRGGRVCKSEHKHALPLKPGAERHLYQPMFDVIEGNWCQAQSFPQDRTLVVDTSTQGSRSTGGKWTRPDIIVATYRVFPFVPGYHFDVISFEIKPVDSVDVSMVYEALAHRRAATLSYALAHVPDGSDMEDVLCDVAAEAKRFGVGLIVAGDPADFSTWVERVEPVRKEPNPQRLNDFIAKQLAPEYREKIALWFR